VSDIDDYLIYRTEQAVLGALLAGADPLQAGPLGPSRFADPVHQAIYVASTVRSANWTGRLRDQVARITSRQVQGAVAYTATLPGLCPDARHLDVYADLLRVAQPQPGVAGSGSAGSPAPRQSRVTGDPGQQLEGASQWLSSAARGRHAQRSLWALSGPVPQAANPKRLDPAVERLARALRAALRSARRRSHDRGARAAVAGPVLAANGTAKPSLRREDLQEAVLADLMRHPGDGRDLVRRVPLNVFTRGPLQDLYRLISLPIAQGRPVDWLIMAWHARKPELSAWGPQPANGTTAAESLAQVAVRLGEMRTQRGTAGVIGRALLGDYEVSMAFGPQWPRQRELNWADAGRPAADTRQASYEPAVTPGAALSAQAAVTAQTVPDPAPRGQQQAAAPRGQQQAVGRHQAGQPAPGSARGPGYGGQARQGRPLIPRPVPRPGTWDDSRQQPGTGPVQQ
jgi:hypothetical protein